MRRGTKPRRKRGDADSGREGRHGSTVMKVQTLRIMKISKYPVMLAIEMKQFLEIFLGIVLAGNTLVGFLGGN